MSERTAIEYARLNRRRRLGRRALGRKQKIAVSPVVATLILILVAVAAAAALYLWLNGWQTGITHSIGNPGAQATVTIGGSTSVYPFESAAVAQFDQNNSGISVSVNQGGTGAGMLAVCSGQVDIGAASTFETVDGSSGLVTADNCPVTTVITTIAWDAVDVIVPTANLHDLSSMSWDTLTAVYDGASTTPATLLAPSIDGVTVTSGILDVAPWSTHAALAWNQIPVCTVGVANCAGSGVAEAVATSVGPGIACTTGTATCATGAGASPCGFTVCGGPFVAVGSVAANDPVKPVMRSDASGTTQTFEARLLGATSATGFAASTAALGFGGCGSNNILADCGMAIPTTGNGNPGVISAVGASADAIGYASDGLVRATGSGVSFVGFVGVGQASATPISPSLGSTGTISYGAQLEEGKNIGTNTPYAGVRPFQWVTTNTPTGEVEQLINWVMDPANNINVAADTAEVSVYSI
jgi:ABC-type phosphate transport system substrate-binding protein